MGRKIQFGLSLRCVLDKPEKGLGCHGGEAGRLVAVAVGSGWASSGRGVVWAGRRPGGRRPGGAWSGQVVKIAHKKKLHQLTLSLTVFGCFPMTLVTLRINVITNFC